MVDAEATDRSWRSSLLAHLVSAEKSKALSALIDALELSDLDLLTLRDIMHYAPRRDDDPLVAVLALLFGALADGATCLPLDGDEPSGRLPAAEAPSVALLVDAFRQQLAGGGYDTLIDRTGEGGIKPLVVDNAGGQRLLYFQKFHFHEQRLKSRLIQFSGQSDRPALPAAGIDGLIDQLYAEAAVIRRTSGGEPIVRDEHQVAAIRAALMSPLLVVSGGPGTGKTALLVNLLRALVRCGIDPSAIRLGAPTGRAAQRMTESLTTNLNTVAELDAHERGLLSLEGVTLHRMLVYRSRSNGFHYGQGRPIPAAVIVLDEVSMVDVVMMDHFFQAVDPDRTRVILMGDKDQLPSVEAGSVLADLRPAADASRISHYVELHNIYRSTGQLRELGRQINRDRPLNLTTHSRSFSEALGQPAGDWSFVAAEAPARLAHHLGQWVDQQYTRIPDGDNESYADLVQRLAGTSDPSDDAAEAYRNAGIDRLFAKAQHCRILTLLRQGPWGCQGINDHIAMMLRQRLDPVSVADPRLFNGALIMITRNDYRRQLFNGDIGVVIRHEPGDYRAYFRVRDGVVAYPASGLSDWNLAFAITVHKSQGSEFADSWLVLPDNPAHRLLTREIVYTAATRASRRLIIYGSVAALQTALKRRIQRFSGLTAGSV